MRKYYGIKEIQIYSNFQLEQCFCSCSVELDKHNKDCPNYGKILSEPETIIYMLLDNGVSCSGILKNLRWSNDTKNTIHRH